jgi:FkbM family methyltransferase
VSKNIENYKFGAHLHFNNLALSNENGEIDFYSVDKKKYNNVGSSSMYPINFRRRPRTDSDGNRDSVQNLVRVNASRFDSLQIPTPDLLAMDTEGSEIKVLKGFGPSIKQVKLIILETSFWNNFQNHSDVSTFPKINQYLKKMAFNLSHQTMKEIYIFQSDR